MPAYGIVERFAGTMGRDRMHTLAVHLPSACVRRDVCGSSVTCECRSRLALFAQLSRLSSVWKNHGVAVSEVQRAVIHNTPLHSYAETQLCGLDACLANLETNAAA
jgi:hypothetical protein